MALVFAIQAEGRSTVYRFEKDSVRLGSSEKKDLDINLKCAPEGTLVVFQREGEHYRIVSAEGSESITLNGAPLKISFIAHDDCIKIGSAEIKLSIEEKGVPLLNREDDFDALLEDMTEFSGLQDSSKVTTEAISELDFDLDKELAKFEALFDIDRLGKEPEWNLDLSEEAIDAFIKGEGHEKLAQQSDQAAPLPITEEADEADSADKQYLSIDESAIDPLLLESIELASEIEPEADEDLFAASKELSIEKEKNNQEKLEEELQKLNQQIIDFQRFGDNDVLEEEAEEEKRQVPWGRYLTQIAAVFLVGMLFSGVFTWFYYKNQSEKNELAAMRGVADIAMAVTYAQVYNVQPYHNNWKDPDFIDGCLNAVLSSKYRAASPIAQGGQLKDNIYQIEVIASHGVEDFLIVAIPRKGMQQMMAPCPLIVLSSRTMDIRKSKAIEPWVQAMKEGDLIDKAFVETLQDLADREVSLRLASLNAGDYSQGFAVLKKISYYWPEGENKVYNAPRYFQLTEPIISKIIEYSERGLSAQEKSVLEEKVSALNRRGDVICYTSYGEEVAGKAAEALASFPANQTLLVAAVELEKDTKMIQSAKALDEEKHAGYYQKLTIAASKSVIKGKQENIAANDFKTGKKTVIDPNDPLFVTLNELFSQRRDALKGLGDQLIDLIQQHNKNDLPNFEEKQKELTKKYEAVSEQFHKKIGSCLKNLYTDYVKNGDLDKQKRFFATVRAVELERFLPEELKNLEGAEDKSADVKIGLEDFKTLLDQIKHASTLGQLNVAVQRAREAMNSADVDSSQQLSYRQDFKAQVLKRVGDFLLSPDFALPKETFQQQDKAILADILNEVEISDSAEKDFYLGEFDHLMEKFREVSHGEMRSLQDRARLIDEDLQKKKSDRAEKNRVALSEERESIVEDLDRLTDPRTLRGSKLGQQILIQQSLVPPGSERDLKLSEAIGLLSDGAMEEKGLWEDILEARRLLTETPRDSFLAALDQCLGVGRRELWIGAKIRGAFSDYIQLRQRYLSDRSPGVETKLPPDTIQEQLKDELNAIIGYTRQAEHGYDKALNDLAIYENRLQEFQRDYLQSLQEGFFVSNYTYHERMIQRLNRKIKQTRELHQELVGLVSVMREINSNYANLAKSEAQQIDSSGGFSKDDLHQVRLQVSQWNYANPFNENFFERLQVTFDLPGYFSSVQNAICQELE